MLFIMCVWVIWVLVRIMVMYGLLVMCMLGVFSLFFLFFVFWKMESFEVKFESFCENMFMLGKCIVVVIVIFSVLCSNVLGELWNEGDMGIMFVILFCGVKVEFFVMCFIYKERV